jgi:endonuclease/exonuclease/phosphatase family metal-dependent hydrolase
MHTLWRLFPGLVHRQVLRVVSFLLLAMVGCRIPPVEIPAPGPGEPFPPSCRALRVDAPGTSVFDTLAWEGSPAAQSGAWCRSTGPALAYHPAGPAVPAALSDLAIVSWNVHLGAGDIDALIHDLRRGRLDGRASNAFVLLLQEVIRAGPDLPDSPGEETRVGRRLTAGPEDREMRSIDVVARRNGLYLLYVPSARNGRGGSPAEDRGNAILSTVPLQKPTALEFPVERQRRVVVSAGIILGAGPGEPMELELLNVHLDLRARWREFYRSLGDVRADQARLVASIYAGEGPAVMGGDLNTWFGGPREAAVRILHQEFPLPETHLDRHTLSFPEPLPGLVLDHLFFRLPDGMRVSSQVVGHRYGSDHHPVLGRITVSGADAGEVAPDGGSAEDGP